MSSLLNYELEQAFVSLVNEAALGEANIYAGRAPDDKALPLAVCSVDGEGEEEPKNTGNFWKIATIQTKSIMAVDTAGADPVEPAVTLADDVLNAVLMSDLDDQLNAQERTLTVFPQGWILGAPRRYQDEQGVTIDEIQIRVYCCASVIPA